MACICLSFYVASAGVLIVVGTTCCQSVKANEGELEGDGGLACAVTSGTFQPQNFPSQCQQKIKGNVLVDNYRTRLTHLAY